MANEIAKHNPGQVVTKPKEGSSLAIAASKIADIYLSDVQNLNAAVGMPMTEESKRCGVNAVLHLCSQLGAEVVQKLPKAQMVRTIQFVTINGLDVFNGQVFMDVRKDRTGQVVSVTATPMGNAYEIMTKRFGVDVKTIHPARVVHEGDKFTMPQFDGLKMTPVHFEPTLEGLDKKAIAVYYLIEKVDGTVDFAVATREGVAKNLMAQILNASLRNASVNRNELMKRMEGKSLDELLSDEALSAFISPAYRSPASRETMIVTKMKKNALLHYTRDLGSKAYASVAETIDKDENSDMVGKDVVAYDDGEQVQKSTSKIADFAVEEEAPEAEAPKEEPTEVVEEPVEEAPEAIEPKPIEEEPEAPKRQASIFEDLEDL